MSHIHRGRYTSHIRRSILLAVFAALAYAAMFAFRFNVSFLTFDVKDAVVTIGGLILGPIAAFITSLLVAVLELITVSDTGWYGFVMNFACTATFSVVCSLVYVYRKKLSGAIAGLVAALVSMVTVMMTLNLLVTPLYMGVPRTDVAALIPTLLFPFNLVKGIVNASLVLILYKPVSRVVQATRWLPRPTHATTPADPAAKRKRLCISLAVTAVGLLLLVGAVCAFLLLLGGQISTA